MKGNMETYSWLILTDFTVQVVLIVSGFLCGMLPERNSAMIGVEKVVVPEMYY